MDSNIYAAQVELLVGVLPYVAKEDMFALKGGTAINLFYRDLPRLSVDIDLTYLPVKDRAESLAEIDAGLDRIAEDIAANVSGTTATRISGGGGGDTRVLVRRGGVEVKVETSPVTRGVVNDPEILPVSEAVEDRFGFAEIQVVAFEDLFAGKLHAALDRQHPRDLYDVKLLYENEGFADALFRTFLIYVASSGRPPHELLSPNLIDLDQPYAREFEGMTSAPVPLDDLIETRAQLIDDVRAKLDERAKSFLLGLHDCEPDFDAIGHPDAANLPAVRWKLINLEKLKSQNAPKHAEQREELLELFDE
ncbi:nucleotidyl transferase AbiEii/AbiGii toxin family protein [Ruegeria sp. HKCCD8929]|uniref:nucleotidyl transferase AbiEii/AbiGii toxin family protein n=1 Tax=Ruegeria sp. HKCCD8929 TaxID=2683006 RepID=UPI001487E9BB|nr:nucleotidyl transferase AbiEii/AbiGii toxin family protein [Ruegeria sp. HKCCD8929]